MTDLGEAMRAAVPDPPSAPTRAEGARLRSRRSRRRLIGGAVAIVAVVAVAIPLGLSLRGDTVDPVTNVADPEHFACPPIFEIQQQLGGSELPEGVVGVRLCRGPRLIDIAPPDDVLTMRADELVKLVNDADVDDGEGGCTADGGPDYALAFSYPDGGVRVARGELYGCEWVRVGRSTRPIAQALLDTFVQLLEAQRAASTPPPSIDRPPRCADAMRLGSGVLGKPEEITQAVLCVTYITSGLPPDYTAVTIPDDDLVVLLEHLGETTAPPATGRPCGLRVDTSLVGRTAWNDVVTVGIRCGHLTAEPRAIVQELVRRSGL